MFRRVLLAIAFSVLLSSPSWAAIAFVTSVEGGDWTATTDTATTASWSLGAGRFVAVCAMTQDPDDVAISSVTDTAGNTYSATVARLAIPAGSGYLWMYHTYNSTANASNVVTVTWASAITTALVLAAEYSGVLTGSDPSDTGNTGTATNDTTVTSGSFTPSQANEVTLACTARFTTNEPITPDANYTVREEVPLINTSDHIGLHLQDRLNAPVSGQTASASFDGAADWWAIIAQTFKEQSTQSRRPALPLLFN